MVIIIYCVSHMIVRYSFRFILDPEAAFVNYEGKSSMSLKVLQFFNLYSFFGLAFAHAQFC